MENIIIISTVLIAFTVTAVSGIWLLPILRKLKFGQTILDIGPKWHKNKQGTPTMGGIMFFIGITLAILIGFITFKSTMSNNIGNSKIMTARVLYGVILSLGFGFIGLADDYIKIVKKQNEGLTPKQKLLLQLLIGTFYLIMLYISGDRWTTLVIPYIGKFDIGFFYYPFAMFAILALSNAVNFTDGIDGLLSSVTFVVGIAFMIICAMLGMFEMQIVSAALIGGCLGFLIWNFHPAKVFMGDTGSLFLSGLIITLAFGTGLPVFILLIGVIYLIEMLSVVIQMTYFKITHGKRLFKMTPIHHSFEMSGYSEVKIVLLFSLITAIGSLIAIIAVRFI